MFVTNPEVLKNTVIVTRVMSEYLIGQGFPLLGHQNDKYYFQKTPQIEATIKNTPIWLKLRQYMK